MCRSFIPLTHSFHYSRLVHRNRVARARFPVRDAGSASLSSHLGGPSCASPQQGFLCASVLVYRSHAARSTAQVLLEVPLHFGLAETDCRLSLCEPFRDAIELGLSQGRNAMGIWQDLVSESGFNGGYQTVKRFVRKLRGNQPPQP
jgi:hypothetical protein